MNKTSVIAFAAAFLVMLLLLSSLGCGRDPYHTARVYAMGTLSFFTVEGDPEEDGDAVPMLVSVLSELEALISHRMEGSLPDLLNKNGSATVSDARLLAALCLSEELREKTNGLFSLSVLPITSLWDFNAEEPLPPRAETLDAALSQMEGSTLRVEGSTVCITGGALDLGAIGKGLAADACADVLRAREESGLVAVGGSIAAVGRRRDALWQIGVRDPFSASQNQTLGTLSLADAFVSTSGSYEKTFSYEGKSYHHILNPHTGMPAESDLISVTVVAESGVLSDALSTACFLVGADAAFALAAEYGASLIAVKTDGTIHVSEGVRERFLPAEGWEVVYR